MTFPLASEDSSEVSPPVVGWLTERFLDPLNELKLPQKGRAQSCSYYFVYTSNSRVIPMPKIIVL